MSIESEQYVVDANGAKAAVILPMAQNEQLLEDCMI